MSKKDKENIVFWLIIAILLFIPFLGNVHLFDWDEINFAEIAREMIVSNNYAQPQINFQSFTEKPPLFFWLQVLSMKLWGINDYAARFPNAILSLVILPMLYFLGKIIRSRQFGTYWALAYSASFLPHLYFKSGIIDPWYNAFIFAAIVAFYAAITKSTNQKWLFLWSGVSLGLAILTKGPVALFLFGFTILVFVALRFKTIKLSLLHLIGWAFAMLLTTSLWLLYDFWKNGDTFLIALTIRQWELLTTKDAGHGGFFLYHFVILLIGCFPSSIFAIQGIFAKEFKQKQSFQGFKLIMIILLCVVLIVFSIVKTKIVHYSSLSYYPLSFLAAISIENIVNHKWKLSLWMKISICTMLLLLILIPLGLNYFLQHLEQFSSLFKPNSFEEALFKTPINSTNWAYSISLIMLILFFISFYHYQKNNFSIAVKSLFWGNIIYIQLILFFFIGKIEQFSQGANVAFWQSHASEDAYITTYGFKSYVPYFYGKAKPHSNSNYVNQDWLLNGNVDKPVYIACKINRHVELEQKVQNLIFLYAQNGFYFYKKKSDKSIGLNLKHN